MADEVTTVEFSTKVYSGAAVQAAREAYAAIMDVALDLSSADKVIARCSNPDLIDAFCNHVLFETIQNFRVTEGTQ